MTSFSIRTRIAPGAQVGHTLCQVLADLRSDTSTMPELVKRNGAR